jgi:hypothetical protein
MYKVPNRSNTPPPTRTVTPSSIPGMPPTRKKIYPDGRVATYDTRRDITQASEVIHNKPRGHELFDNGRSSVLPKRPQTPTMTVIMPEPEPQYTPVPIEDEDPYGLDDAFADSVPVARIPRIDPNAILSCESCGKPVKGNLICLECRRKQERADTHNEVAELTPSGNEPTGRCYICHTTMVLSALKSGMHGGLLCQNRKGCDERRELRLMEVGSEELRAAMTPKESAIAALTGNDESVTTIGQGIRIVQPTAKEVARHQGEGNNPTYKLAEKRGAVTGATYQEYIRVTDEDEPIEETKPAPEKTSQVLEQVLQGQHPFIRTKIDNAKNDLADIIKQEGFRWVLNETLESTGYDSTLTSLMGVICESANDEGHMPYGGFLTVLEALAKSSKLMGHKALAFFIAETYFRETGKRVRGF